MAHCAAEPTLTVVGSQIHIECEGCGMDYYVPCTLSR